MAGPRLPVACEVVSKYQVVDGRAGVGMEVATYPGQGDFGDCAAHCGCLHEARGVCKGGVMR